MATANIQKNYSIHSMFRPQFSYTLLDGEFPDHREAQNGSETTIDQPVKDGKWSNFRRDLSSFLDYLLRFDLLARHVGEWSVVGR
jgi:hypothetical protein